MSGLAQLVPYFECQYPQVVPGSVSQIETVINSGGAPASGVGDYLEGFNWPIPQYLAVGNNRGLGCDCGCGGECGLGQGSFTIGTATINLSAPGGYFSTGDFTQWGLEEWATVAAAAYFLLSLWADTKTVAKRVSTRSRKIRKGFS
jgi:hypothetical protein